MTSNNVVFENHNEPKHYKNYAPLYNLGTRIIIGKYGTMAMEHMKKTAPLAYKAYSEYPEFKYMLAEINENAADWAAKEKAKLKKKYPAPKTDDFVKLAEHNSRLEKMAEQAAIKKVVLKKHISDSEIKTAKKAKHAKKPNSLFKLN